MTRCTDTDAMLSALENRRKLLHMIFGIATVVLLQLGVIGLKELLLIIIAGVLISFASKKSRIPVISWFLDRFERADTKEKFPGKGTIYFFAGAALSMLLFEKYAALAAVMILSLGDSVAPLAGQFGRIKNPASKEKFIEGAIAGMAAAFLGASLFVNLAEAFVASACAMVAEGANIRFLGEKLDDNIYMPLVAGAAITLLRIAGV